MKSFFKDSVFPCLIAFVVFLGLAMIYCAPQLEGKVVQAGDVTHWKGGAQEWKQYLEETGRHSFWTGSMFAGMPTYQLGGGKMPSADLMTPLVKVVRFGFIGALSFLMLYFIGFYLLMRSFSINKWLSIVGAIAVSLSSYFFIIIEAGHNTKVQSIGLMVVVVAGFMLIFRKKYVWGAFLTMLYTAVGIMLHPQMAYYIFMLIGLLMLAELWIHIREKRLKDFLVAIGLFAVSVGVGIASNTGKLLSNNEYLKETMRGGHSELQKVDDAQNKTKGLDLDYATAWSYGIDESFTFLIPNFKGASSHYSVGTDSKLYETLVGKGVPKRSAEEFCRSVPTYWGTQPFTSGPVYMGAVVCFLFVLGLFLVKGPYKWALLVATLFSLMLSWGHNFMPLTRFFFDWFPMYNKFRAVSSILIVAEITMPLLGFLAVKAIMDHQLSRKELCIGIAWSAGITAGICLLFALFGGLIYDFSAPNDAQMFSQLPKWLSQAILDERAAMLRSDAWRSLLFIVLAALCLWLFVSEKIKLIPMVSLMGVLVLADMWPVDQRFFNHDNFVTRKENNSYFAKQPYEEYILQDKDPHFRVLNLATNTFNDSRTSYYLKSLGGYHAAKLRRYQDLIDNHISKMNLEVISMLNAKYIIVPDKNGQAVPQLNPQAMGNAWFVDSLLVVDTPNQECDALHTINLRSTAVLDAKFADFAPKTALVRDSAAKVELLAYAPDELSYRSQSANDGVVVFSEVYYPYGWKAYIDDEPVAHYRVNYLLRALTVPAGRHDIRFEFRPDSVYRYDLVSIAFLVVIYATFLLALWTSWRSYKQTLRQS